MQKGCISREILFWEQSMTKIGPYVIMVLLLQACTSTRPPATYTLLSTQDVTQTSDYSESTPSSTMSPTKKSHVGVPSIQDDSVTESVTENGSTRKADLLDSMVWLELYSPDLHISLSYPSGWQLETPNFAVSAVLGESSESERILRDDPYTAVGYVLGIVPPQEGEFTGKKIEITAQSFEIPQEQTLSDWYNDLQTMGNLIHYGTRNNPDSRTIDVTSEKLRKSQEPRQVLHIVREYIESGPFGQTVLITHGKIVYVIAAYGYSSEFERIVADIVGSITFDADAPTDLKELHGPNFTSKSLKETLEEFEQLFIGVEGCDIVCRDEQALNSLNSTPEAQSEAINEDTQPSISASQSGRYRGSNVYSPQSLFEIDYAQEEWHLVIDQAEERPTLMHQRIAGCALMLKEGPREYRWLGTREIAEREWRISLFLPDYLIYSLPIGGQAYIFRVELPSTYDETVYSECEQSAERVLATFTLVDEE